MANGNRGTSIKQALYSKANATFGDIVFLQLFAAIAVGSLLLLSDLGHSTYPIADAFIGGVFLLFSLAGNFLMYRQVFKTPVANLA